MEDKKLPPYNRLKSILTEGDLTEKGSKNLDAILGVEKTETLFDKIKKFFSKIDSFIFAKGSKVSKTNNTQPHRRLR